MTTVLADIGIGPISIPTPGDVVTALKNAVIDVADAVFDKIIEWIAGLLADAVTKVTEALVTLLSAVRTTLTPGGAITDAAPIQASVLGLAAALVALFFVFRIIHGLITGQAGQSLRATLVDLPMVIVGTLFFGFLCYTLLAIVDEFSDPLITTYASSLSDTVVQLYSQDGIVQGGVFVIIFALLYIVAAVFLCFELFVRSSLIYLVVMFAPLAIATRIWGPTRSYARRATETAVALIFSKLAIAVTLATGASLMAGATESGGNVAMIQGSAILLLAAFMPFGLMRVIPMMEGAVAGEGVARTMGMKAAGGALIAGEAAQHAAKPVSAVAGRIRGNSQPASSSGSSGNGDAPSTDSGGSQSPPPGGGSPPSSGGGGGSQTQPAGSSRSPSSEVPSTTTAATGTTAQLAGTQSASGKPAVSNGATTTGVKSGTTERSPAQTDVPSAGSAGVATTPVAEPPAAEQTQPKPAIRVVSRPPILTPSQRAEVACQIDGSASPAPTVGSRSTSLRKAQPRSSETSTPTQTSAQAPAETKQPVPLAKSRTIARPPLSPAKRNEDSK